MSLFRCVCPGPTKSETSNYPAGMCLHGARRGSRGGFTIDQIGGIIDACPSSPAAALPMLPTNVGTSILVTCAWGRSDHASLEPHVERVFNPDRRPASKKT